MKKIFATLIAVAALACCLLVAGCGSDSTPAGGTGLEEGTYTAEFKTDRMGMIHLNEACEGRCTLTVDADGNAVAHLIMPSKTIQNLFLGVSDDAKKDGADLIEAQVEKVVYDDGYEQEVHAFDLPVPVIDEEFDMALIGEKGKWYDHKVTISDVQPA